MRNESSRTVTMLQLVACYLLQDFEALTPNLLARTIETVEGGGIVVLLLSTLTSLTQLYSLTMDVHSRLRTESHQDVTGQWCMHSSTSLHCRWQTSGQHEHMVLLLRSRSPACNAHASCITSAQVNAYNIAVMARLHNLDTVCTSRIRVKPFVLQEGSMSVWCCPWRATPPVCCWMTSSISCQPPAM